MREQYRLINHLMGCLQCKPRSSTYCDEGRRLRIRHNAEYIASLPRLEDRQRWIGYMRQNMPYEAPKIEALVIDMFEQRCKDTNTRVYEVTS